MKQYVSVLQGRFSEELSRAAHEYLETGLGGFHDNLEMDSSVSQATLGNIAVGLELLLKSYIASKNLSNIFRNMPPDIRLFLSNPESVPAFFKWRNLAVDIRMNAYETISFSDCINCFYMLFPHLKQLYMTHMRVLVKMSAQCLHSIMPPLDRFAAERIGYVVFGVVSTLGTDESFTNLWYTMSDEDTSFIKKFERRREERVALGIEQAKRISGDKAHETVRTVIAQDWNALVIECPVCRFNGLLDGYTELAMSEDEEGTFPSLDFFASGFHCEECGLTLYDSEELRLAGMNTLYDRSDDIDRWFTERDTSFDLFTDGNM